MRREIDALRERISRLSAAILRTSATLGDAGQPREFVSSGLTPEEHQRLTS